MKNIIRLVVPVVLFFFALPHVDHAAAQKTEYKIQPTDVLKITVHEQEDLTTRTRVTADGYISFPLLGKVNVLGLAIHEIESKIHYFCS